MEESRAGRRDAGALSDLAHRIYDAGVQPERWNEVVASIAASFSSTKALLFTPYLAPQHGGLVFPAGISESTLQLWGSSYIDHDIWALNMRRRELWRDGAVFVDEQMVPRDEFLASRFYQEFLSTIGIGRVCLGMVFDGAPGLPPASLSIFRDIHDPPFNDADVAWMRLLVSHVSRSLGVMQRLDLARIQHSSLNAAFDRLGFGVALLDADMCVQHLNQAAQNVVARRDGIALNAVGKLESIIPGQRKLTARGKHTTQSRRLGLSQWLDNVRIMPDSRHVHFLDGCQVPRKDGRRHYIVQCSPISTANDWAMAESAIRFVAFITDPSAQQLPKPERLMSLYGLTRTQARVALAFANGQTYKQVARTLRISEETVRSHVKEIYPKTRVNRQADLVRLILSLSQSRV